MDIHAVGERVCQSFTLIDEEVPAERRELLNTYLNRLTQHVSTVNGSPTKYSLMIAKRDDCTDVSTYNHMLTNHNNNLPAFDGNKLVVASCSNKIIQKRISPACIFEEMVPDAKRRRFWINSERDAEACSNKIIQKRISPACIFEEMVPDAKRRRFWINSERDAEASKVDNMEFSSHADPAMAQLAGKFSLSMDLWSNTAVDDFQSTVDDDSCDGIFLVEVTDEEMNKFWDTLPKEFGGFM
ncbi:unnamed protein product [Adineta ricciae]|uniref:Uncharacterized protein n=1 Tax=Adineta ricciae TaxID=249248 RepID=A0A815NI85_ADIRI|nr:unnamed protein product [Adineta ricciae]